MSKQSSLAHFFKQPSGASLLSNLFPVISNDPDLDVTKKESKLPIKKVKLITKLLKYDESYVEYGFTYVYENNIDLS